MPRSTDKYSLEFIFKNTVNTISIDPRWKEVHGRMTDWDIQRKEKTLHANSKFCTPHYYSFTNSASFRKKIVQTPAIPRKSPLICFAQNVKVLQNEFDANSAQKLVQKKCCNPYYHCNMMVYTFYILNLDYLSRVYNIELQDIRRSEFVTRTQFLQKCPPKLDIEIKHSRLKIFT